MSTHGDFSGARRVTRQSSRASSRAPSEETPSVTADAGPTTRRSARNARETSATPSKPTKVTNKASASYGGKGRSQGPGLMSAAAGNQTAESAIASAIAEGGPTESEAGKLPVLTEEGESSISGAQASSRRRQQSPHATPSEPVASAQTHSEAHETTQDVLNAQLQGTVHNQAEPNSNAHTQSATAGQTQSDAENVAPVEVTTSWYHYSRWTPRNRDSEEAVNREADGGFWNNHLNRDRTMLRIPQGSIVKAFIGSVIIAILALILFPFGHYANTAFPSKDAAQSTQALHGRVSKLEKIVHRLNSMSPFPKIAPTVHRINWFAAGNGAVVDPYLSSPVDLICQNTETNWLLWIMNIRGACKPASHMHGQVLRPWSEPDDRFCAPPGRGKLQLSVLTARPVAPTEVVIEHMPKHASIFIGDAPKEIEFWVKIEDAQVHDKVLNTVQSMFPAWATASSPQQDRELAPDQALPADYVLVARWTYNIWESDNIQSFKIPFHLDFLGVASTKFAFRVSSNWGDYAATCIHRLRLYGKDASGILEDLEADPRLS